MRRLPFIYTLTLILFLILSCHVKGQSVFDKKVKAYYHERALISIMIDMKIDHKLKFEYQLAEVEEVYITASIPRVPIREAMKYLLAKTDLDFRLKEPNTIVIFRSEKKNKEPDILASSDSPEKFDFTVSGVVRDANSGESLPHATLQIPAFRLGTNTNVDGWFSLLHVPSDTVLLRISYIGYQNAYFRLSPGMEMQKLDIRMTPLDNILSAVNIVGEKEDQMMKASTGISQISISPAQLTAVPSLGEKDIFRSLQLLPGVSGSNESSSGLYIRGGTPDQNLVLFDGFTVYHVDHLFGFFSAFNNQAIKDVQLFKGGFEAKYGGRLSSVVDITGKDGNSEEFNIGAGISLLSANVSAEIPFDEGKGTILLTGRRSFQSGLYNRLLDLSDGGSTGTEEGEVEEQPTGPPFGRRGFANVEPESWFYDLNLKGTYRSGKDIFSISMYNGQDELDNSRYADENTFRGLFGQQEDPEVSFSQDIIDQSNWGNTGASLKWSRRWSDKLYSNLLFSGSNYFSYRDRGNQTLISRPDTTIDLSNKSVEDNNLLDYSVKYEWEWQLTPMHKLEFGAFGSYLDIRYDFTQNDSTTVLARDDQGLLGGLYLQTQSSIFEKVSVKPGIRMTYYQPTEEILYEPRLQLQWFPTKNIKVKGAIGRFYQFANRIIREDISQGSRDFWILSDGESVPIGKSDHLILGLGYENSDYLFDVEAYYKKLDNITEYSTRFVLNGFGPNSTLNFEENFYNGQGLARGIEFLAQKKSGNLTGWISYTLGRVEHEYEVYGDEPFPANHDVTNELKVVGVYRVGKLSFGATFVYATGRPYTAPLGAYTVELLDGETSSHFAVSSRNSLRLPDYHRLDLSINYDLNNFLGGKAQTGFSIFNFYNRSNIWYKEFDVVDGTILETNVNFLGFTPSLYLNWNLK
ncbi:MAG: TonB-dependent receptor [Bacteroidota bacterium]